MIRLRPHSLMLLAAALACDPPAHPPVPADAPFLLDARIEAAPTPRPGPPPTPSPRPATPRPARPAEVEAVLDALRPMTPPQKLKAYEKLLASRQAGLDEVFLVGLNEDDGELLRVVARYFRDHHPPEAIGPLLEVLVFVQGDTALRTELADTLATFGGAAIGPILATVREEPSGRLEGGAMKGLAHALGGLFERGGPTLLGEYLAVADGQGVLLLAQAVGAEERPLPADGAAVRRLADRLQAELGRPRPDVMVVDACLQILCRIGLGQSLPEEVRRLPPLIARSLPLSPEPWGIRASVVLGDGRVTPALAHLAREGGVRRFWALQALGAVGDRRAVPVFVRALGGADADVRDAAAWAVGHRLWTEAAPALREAVGRQGAASLPLIEALGALRDPASRRVLEGALAGSPRDVQAAALRALLPLGDAAVAQRLGGWVEVELLAPARQGRLDLRVGPSRSVVEAAALLLAAHGGAEALDLVAELAIFVGGGPRGVASASEVVGREISRGLGPLLVEAYLPKDPASTGRLSPLGNSLLSLPMTPETAPIVRRILAESPSPEARLAAAVALFHGGSAADVPALEAALRDPWYVAGPFPTWEYPVRRISARALERLGVRVDYQADRVYAVRR